jgi:putative ABC transport system permease protein
MSRPADLRRALWLAAQDFIYEWRMSACLVLGLSAILTPLLILFGLKFGLIDTMTSRLLAEPRNREIKPVGSGAFGAAWFADMAGRPEVAFVIERTRSIAATMNLQGPDSPRGRFVTVELVPTGPGDPLLRDETSLPEGPAQIVLSAAAARKLSATAGQVLNGSVARRAQGSRQVATATLQLVGVLPESSFARDGALVAKDLLVAVEDYRDGRAAPALGWPGEDVPAGERTFASFRLYARSIFDVPPLRDLLAAQGLEVRTQAAEIETVQALDRSLGAIFWIIALTALAGFLLSLASSLWANVDRKRRELGVMRLVGFSTLGIVWFPVCQALYIALLGSVLAGGLYVVLESAINGLFQASLRGGELVCKLLPLHYAVATVATLAAAAAASALAGLRAAHIEPGEGLRDV